LAANDKQISGIKNGDVIVPDRRASASIALSLRLVTAPEPRAAQLRSRLGLRLPKGTHESRKFLKTNPRFFDLPDSVSRN
jgi:hypothetical protein